MSQPDEIQLNLVADVGGTNTRVALARGANLVAGSATKFANRDFSDLGSVLQTYISDQGNIYCAGACVAVAGPVQDGTGHLTNLNWSIDRALLIRSTSAANVAVLNDLQAQGHGLHSLPQQSLKHILGAPEPKPNAAKLVVGIGTGFNAAVVYALSDRLLVPPSESGHADLPTQTTADFQLANAIRREHGFCAVDEVLSGRGLERIYNWHSQEAGNRAELSAADIMQSLASNTDPIAKNSARHFVHLAAVTIGNLALTYLPYGGVYLAGGVARAFAPYLAAYGFEQSFKDKGRFADFMDNFSVSIIEDDDAALNGCARYLGAQTLAS